MFKDQLPPVFPISDALFQQCCKYLDTDIDWEQAVSDYEFKTKLSEIARDILRKAGSEEETLENLQKVAKDLVRKTDRNTLDFYEHLCQENRCCYGDVMYMLLFISFLAFLKNLWWCRG